MEQERWKCQILNPVNGKILWEGKGKTWLDIEDKWKKSNNWDSSYITRGKLARLSSGRSKNKHLKLYRIGEFASKNIEIDSPNEDLSDHGVSYDENSSDSGIDSPKMK